MLNNKSKRFWKIFLVRFLGYFFTMTGVIVILLIVEPVFGEEGAYLFNQISGKQFVLPRVVTSVGSDQASVNLPTPTPKNQGFGSLNLGGSETIVPVSTDFGIVVEKINANARVVANVDPAKESEYLKALAQGVAHAKGTVFPGQKGNIYLFSHSADAPWNIVRYNAIFYLLSKLENGDRVIMFYQGRRYDYIVFDKAIVKGNDIQYLTATYDQSVLTLQTCDPPGTVLNRMIVRAKLVSE